MATEAGEKVPGFKSSVQVKPKKCKYPKGQYGEGELSNNQAGSAGHGGMYRGGRHGQRPPGQSISLVLPKTRAGGQGRAVPARRLGALGAVCSLVFFFFFFFFFFEENPLKPKKKPTQEKPKAKENGKE